MACNLLATYERAVRYAPWPWPYFLVPSALRRDACVLRVV